MRTPPATTPSTTFITEGLTGGLPSQVDSIFDFGSMTRQTLQGFDNKHLEQQYTRYNQQAFVRFVRLIAPLFLLLLVTLPILWAIFYKNLGNIGTSPFFKLYLYGVVILFIGFGLSLWPRFAAQYDIFGALMLPPIMLVQTLALLTYPTNIAVYVVTNIHLLYLIIMFVMRVRTKILVPAMLVSFMLNSAVLYWQGTQDDTLTFLYANGVFGFLLLWLSYNFERYIRYTFLQQTQYYGIRQKLVALDTECQALREIDPVYKILTAKATHNRLLQEISIARRNRHQLLYMLVDIDYFGLYKEQYSKQEYRQVGFQVAQAINKQLDEIVIPRHLLGVFDQTHGSFQLALPLLNTEHAQDLAEGIINAVNTLKIPHRHSLVSSYVTVSIGCTALKEDDTLESLLNRAHNAVKIAIQDGRKRYVYLNPQWQSPTLGD